MPSLFYLQHIWRFLQSCKWMRWFFFLHSLTYSSIALHLGTTFICVSEYYICYLQPLSSLSDSVKQSQAVSIHFERKPDLSTSFLHLLKGGNLIVLQSFQALFWTVLGHVLSSHDGPGILQLSTNSLVDRTSWPYLFDLSSDKSELKFPHKPLIFPASVNGTFE